MTIADPSKLKVARQLPRADILLAVARVPRSSRLFFGSSDFNVYAFDLSIEWNRPRLPGTKAM